MITAEEIRKSMRISHINLDKEIKNNIDICLLDLERVGVNTKTDNKLSDKAIELYCKSQFDYQGKGAEYQKAYEKLRDDMSLSGGYCVRPGDQAGIKEENN